MPIGMCYTNRTLSTGSPEEAGSTLSTCSCVPCPKQQVCAPPPRKFPFRTSDSPPILCATPQHSFRCPGTSWTHWLRPIFQLSSPVCLTPYTTGRLQYNIPIGYMQQLAQLPGAYFSRTYVIINLVNTPQRNWQQRRTPRSSLSPVPITPRSLPPSLS